MSRVRKILREDSSARTGNSASIATSCAEITVRTAVDTGSSEKGCHAPQFCIALARSSTGRRHKLTTSRAFPDVEVRASVCHIAKQFVAPAFLKLTRLFTQFTQGKVLNMPPNTGSVLLNALFVVGAVSVR